MWCLWVSKNAEFYVDFKHIPLKQNAPEKSYFKIKCQFGTFFNFSQTQEFSWNNFLGAFCY
jgi:hypothetical protein